MTTYTYPHHLTHGMAVVDVDQARNDLSEMVDRVQDGERITITSRSCNAVLMSEDDYNSLIETLHLLSDPDMAADLDRTRGTPLSEMEVWTQRSRTDRPFWLFRRAATYRTDWTMMWPFFKNRFRIFIW